MVVRVNSKILQRRFARLLKNVEDRDTFRKLGFFVIKTIRDRTRKRGKGVARPGGNLRTLKPVSKQWAVRRQAERRHPEAAGGTKSNLTFKGTMLDSLIIKRANKNGLFIGFRTKKQEDKAEGNTARGRPFMNLSRTEIRSATDFLKDEILKKV